MSPVLKKKQRSAMPTQPELEKGLEPDPRAIRMLDLMKMNIDSKDIVSMSIRGDEVIKSLTP